MVVGIELRCWSVRKASLSLRRAASVPHLVLESLPNPGDAGETQLLHSSEMEHLAMEFAEYEPEQLPEAPLATCWRRLFYDFKGFPTYRMLKPCFC